MNADEVRARIEGIRQLGEDDDEAAHATEDYLRADLLRHFAAEAPEPFAELARLALETEAFGFARHCA